MDKEIKQVTKEINSSEMRNFDDDIDTLRKIVSVFESNKATIDKFFEYWTEEKLRTLVNSTNEEILFSNKIKLESVQDWKVMLNMFKQYVKDFDEEEKEK